MSKKIISYDEITYQDLISLKNNKIVIMKNNVNFHLKLFLKKHSKNLIAFSNGAVDYTKKKPPVFMREKWQGDYDANCIYIDDPTLHNSNLRVGWGFGEDNHYYLESISIIIKEIANLLNIKSENTIYFGSSAGGFMSMMLATMHPGTTAVVNNPQFTVKQERYINFVKSKYPKYTHQEIKEKFSERFSFYVLSETHKYFPKVFYIINRYSKADVNLQYTPFQKYIDKHSGISSKVEFIQYHSPNGHSGLYSREQTSKLLNNILEEWAADKYISTTNIYPNIEGNFSVKNIASDTLTKITYNNSIYIPKEFFQANNFSEVTFIFNSKSGILKLSLLSKYRFKSGRNLLQYSILKNDGLVSIEDMSQFNRPNDINLFNLVKGDRITIRVKTLKTQSTESWKFASTLHILQIEEFASSILFPEQITFTSPFMKKISKP